MDTDQAGYEHSEEELAKDGLCGRCQLRKRRRGNQVAVPECTQRDEAEVQVAGRESSRMLRGFRSITNYNWRCAEAVRDKQKKRKHES